MPTTDQLQFEMQRRVILFNSGTTMPDNSVLGYEGNPNSANTSTPGQTLLYNSPRGTSYIELVNGNLWYKQQIPNTWINLTSGTVSGTANFSSQNNVVFTTGNQDISGVKNFYSRPTVNGSGVLLIGETGSVVLPNTLVYTTGDQTINGLKDFTTRPTVNTIPVLLSGEVNTTISGVLYSAQINIKNDNGSTIYRGQPVYVSSAAGSNILVKLASNSGEQTSSKTLGLVYQTSLAQNAQGTIVTEGLLQGFNTNAGEEGDPIWLGPTGSLIFGLANKPYAPNHLVYLGVVTRKQANQGEVFVKIQNGFELDELHNVNINHRNALVDKNIIRYDSLSGIWFNDTINSVLPNSIVYNTGNQIISGNKTFDVFPVVSGNKLITGLDLSSYATTSNLFSTGSILDNKINSLSGYVSGISAGGLLPNSIVYVTGNQTISGTKTFANNLEVQGTGIFNALDLSNISEFNFSGTNINLINGNVNISGGTLYISGNAVLTGVNLNAYATTANLFATGSTLDNKINSLSGYVNSQDIIFSGQTFNTGSRLDNKINALSGYVNSQDIIFSGQTASTGSILDNKINSLSGYVSGISAGGGLPSTIVYVTGNQLISGNKTFINNIAVSGTGDFNSVKVSNIDKLFLSGIDILITGNSSINVYNAIYISGNPVLTGVIPSSQIITDVVYTTGNQIISGVKTFASRPTVNGTGVLLSGEAINFTLPNTIVYTTGDQIISGNKTFLNNLQVSGTGIFQDINIINLNELVISGAKIIIGGDSGVYSSSNIYISGNQVLTGVDLSSCATSINLASTGSILDNKINSLSGYVNAQSNSGQVFNTGSILDNKINSLSGYVNSQDIIFSGQTASTGSILDNKINALSGYVSGISAGGLLPNSIVYTTGNQIISGNKTFVNNVIISGTGIFDAIDLNNIDTLNLSGVDISITNGNVSLTNRPTVNGSGVVLSGELNPIIVNTGSILDNKINSLSGYVNSQDIIFSGQTANTGSRLDNKINALSGYVNSQTASGQIFNTGSVLDSKINSLSGYVNSQGIIIIGQIASTGSILDNKINSLSGYVNSQDNIFSGQTFNTGSRLDNKINSLSGYINAQNIVFSGQTFNTGSRLNNKIDSLSGYINSPASNIVYTTGDQIISGDKNFAENVVVGDQAQNDILIIFDNKITFGVYPTVNGTGIVYTQGNQIISGIKTFNVAPIVSGNRLITGDLSSYASITNLFNTGSRLDSKINALSGYVSGISLGGLLPNTIVYNTGNQTISGIKTFANGANQILNTTYSNLTGLKSSGNLLSGQLYRISDFVLKWNNQSINDQTVKTAVSGEPLIVAALSNNKIHHIAQSEIYPQDTIYYNIDAIGSYSWGTINNNAAIPDFKGWIYRRVDNLLGIDIPYDWRNIRVNCCKPDVSSVPYYFPNVQYTRLDYVIQTGNINRGKLYYSVATGNSGNSLSDPNFWNPVSYFVESGTFFSTDESYGFRTFFDDNLGEYRIDLPALTTSRIQQPTFTSTLTGLGTFILNDVKNIQIQGGYSNVIIGENFQYNTIGNSFANNTIGNGFRSNTIGNGFSSNNILAVFLFNNIANSFTNNNLGNSFQFNNIGNGFSSNNIGNSFVNNTIGNSFFYGIIGNDFLYNNIGNSFANNTIGNSFISNNIGSNFQTNTIGNNFNSNIAENNFNNVDFSSSTHVYNSYNTTLFQNSANSMRLRYFNSSDQLVVTDPTA
jgi:Na+-transporting NADH:ubiquinone oxidoreductase subunit NqrA